MEEEVKYSEDQNQIVHEDGGENKMGDGGPKVEDGQNKMIQRVGKILNEDGEWVDYIEEDDPNRPPIAYDYIGQDNLQIEDDAEIVDFCMQYRIPKIEGLTNCVNLKKLGLRKNLVKKIEGIENCTQLIELELYDNKISKIENLNHLSNLVILDLAFNVIKEITPGSLDGLINLKKIFLSANKIKKMQGLNNLLTLEVLDLGDNRIRKIENIENLTNLRELHLAKNKIQIIENIGHLKQLYMLTIQANFIQEIQGLDELPQLEQVYFQQNKIKQISGLENLKQLEILDLALNEISELSGLESQAYSLDELWINDNKISEKKCLEYLGNTLKKLSNLYIAMNPVYSRTNEFKDIIKKLIPSLTQLEGSPFDRPVYYFKQPEGVNSIVKKGINPKAKAILEDILGKSAADEYHKEQEELEKEEQQLSK